MASYSLEFSEEERWLDWKLPKATLYRRAAGLSAAVGTELVTARVDVAPHDVVTLPSLAREASQLPTSTSEHFQIAPDCMQPTSDSARSAALPRRQVDTTSSATPG